MYILGLAALRDDPSACLLKDGKLVAAAEEERFIRIKHAWSHLPENAIDFCLKYANIAPHEVDHVAVPYLSPGKSLLLNFTTSKIPLWRLGLWWRDYSRHKKLLNLLSQKGITGQVHYIEHHIAHAASSFRCSGFRESNILTMDDHGELTSTLLSRGEDEKIIKLREIFIPNSLGRTYAAFTQYLGFQAGDGEGKVMGLASYGKPKYDLTDLIEKTENGYKAKETFFGSPLYYMYKYIISGGKASFDKYNIDLLTKKYGTPRDPKEYALNEVRFVDLASSMQKKLEDISIHLVNTLYKESDSKNLCIAGGVGLNMVMNGRLFQEDVVENIFIQPAANDAGLSIGAALELYANMGKNSNFIMEHAYWGPKYSDKEIKNELDAKGLQYELNSDIAGVTGELLAKGKIIGWFQGRMEIGPRSLGGRTILADPRDPKMKDKVNNKVKFREDWRPFSPSILNEAKEEYFEDACESPFMLLAFNVFKEKINEIPSVVHVDGTARPQTVDKRYSPIFWNLIKSFEGETSIPVVLNTSFNVRGEPIVCSPNDAINCYLKTGMDALAIGNYLVMK